MEENLRIHLIITGRVQAVWYRGSAQKTARRLGLSGWVRNLPDNSVELVAEGPTGQLDKLVKWCQEGPPLAHVTDIRTKRSPARGEFLSFEMR